MKKAPMSPLNPKPMSGEEAHRHQRAHPREGKAPMEVKNIDPRRDDINECADAFIKRFRQQLEIQRLESIENYEQMLARDLSFHCPDFKQKFHEQAYAINPVLFSTMRELNEQPRADPY
ncbi:hypothetical protein CKAN_00590700 [Cinnamomum micranthum f. kanehirae]|uniref:Uncharacterized protein n=1 Tax=Cinnamomum micranthum f. kanehirae TaxID=337451 RepID=A0A3S3MYQ3_9MAGN|nr:hypothetical protein CKAN_00590700 [Cinnamomum micranthum f. kanehirae]